MKISLTEIAKENSEKSGESPKFLTLPFCHDGIFLSGKEFPRWGMTLRAAGNMRFRWNEKNSLRDAVLQKICCTAGDSCKGNGITAMPIELIHSKEIYFVENIADTFQKQGDGILTQSRMLLPVVTVADCVPIFLCDTKSGAFGVLHSGWKGTGIVAAAIEMLCKKFPSKATDIIVAIGPHINDCCYFVDEGRAEYFANNFGNSSVKSVGGGKYSLSLLRANLSLLEKIGVPQNNIIYATDCTCCNKMFGSFRREACDQTSARLASFPADSNRFTVQAAFCGFV